MKSWIVGSLLLLFLLIYALYFVSNPTRQTSQEPITLYCAAGIKMPVEEIVKLYEQDYGIPIQIQYGGSGTLLSNLKVSQTGDLYLAADASYTLKAKEEKLVEEIIPLAVMKPVIVVAKGNPKQIHTPRDLLRADVAVALGSPEAAAVGQITQTLLTQEGLWDAIQPKVKVFKPTVNDIANDIKIGSVDAGILWDSIARFYPELEMIEPPGWEVGNQHVSVGVLTSAARPASALHFARYLSARDKGLLFFEKWGFTPVKGDFWEETPEITLFSGGVNRIAIQDTLKAFEQREGCRITVVYNGCGILVGQMKTGQRPDAYFACDASFMDDVSDLFLDVTVISQTDMVILVPKGNPKAIQTLADLTQPHLKLGVANAEQSALGALTHRLLSQLHLLDDVMKNVVVQTPTADLLVNQIQTGSLDAVIVYEANTSQVLDTLDLVRIDHPSATAVQPIAVGKDSPRKQIVQRLLDTLQSEASLAVFRSSGFAIPSVTP
jgi:molybdenum ABC transporter molybdate-binding protein